MFFRVILLFFLVGSLRAVTTNDPSEEFVAAYRSFKEAERLDQAGRKEEAMTKYRYAENHLIDISNNYPNWQKPIVEYRLSKIRNNLARITTSSGPSRPSAYNSAGRPSGEGEGLPLDNHRGDSSFSDEERREEPPESSRDNTSESTPTEISPSSSSSSLDSESLEESPKKSGGSKRTGDIPTLSVIPRSAKNPSPNNKELLELQQKLKRTETELDKAQHDIVDKTTELDHSKVSLIETKAELTKTEREIADLKNDLEKNRVGNLEREAGLKKRLQQLQGKVVALSADKEVMLEENNSLQQHLQQASNSLATAVVNKNRLEQLQVELNTEKNASAAFHEQLIAAQRERAEAHAESATLAQQIKQASDSLAVAEKKGHELEGLQNRVTTLQQQLDQNNDALVQEQKKSAEMDALKMRLAALTEEGTHQEKMLADAQEAAIKTQEANRKLELSHQRLVDDLQKKLETAQADQEVLNEERNNIEVRLKQRNKELALLKKSGSDETILKQEIATLTQELEKNKKRLSDTQASEIEAATVQKKALVELEEKYRVAVVERQNMEIKKSELEQQLTAANQQIKSLMSQPVSNVTTAEVQQYQAQLQATKMQLEESEKKIAALEKAEPEKIHLLQEKEKELTAAREEAGKFQKELLAAQQQLTSIQEEVKNRDDRYHELKKQLDQKNEEIAMLQKKTTPDASQQKVVAENELLKGVVLRELKAEAKRQQLRKLIMEDLEKLKVKSDTLSLQLRKLAKPVKLTPEERALFKDKLTFLPEKDQEDEKLMVSVEVSKNEKNVAANNTAAVPSETNKVMAEASPVPTNIVSAPPITNNVLPALIPTPRATEMIAANAPTEMKKQEEIKGGKKETSIDQEKYNTAINKAKEQFEHQNYTEAEKSFQDALSASPNDYMTLSNLGVVEFQLGKISDAENILKQACVQDHKKSFAFTTLGIVHYRQERFDDAEKVLRQAVAINDQDFTAHNYLGIVLAASGKNKAGESEIMKSIEISPNYADAHFNLAVIYATGKPPVKEMAKLHYKKALSLGASPDPTLEKLVN